MNVLLRCMTETSIRLPVRMPGLLMVVLVVIARLRILLLLSPWPGLVVLRVLVITAATGWRVVLVGLGIMLHTVAM